MRSSTGGDRDNVSDGLACSISVRGYVVDHQPRSYPVLAASDCDEKAIQAWFPNAALKKLKSRDGTGAVVALGRWYLDQTPGGGLVHLE
jgi:hypothetical protein